MAAEPSKPQFAQKGNDHQEWQRLHRRMTAKPPPGASGGGSGWDIGAPRLGGHSTGSAAGELPSPRATQDRAGPGVGEVPGEKAFGMAGGAVEHVWPLQACVRLGERMADAGRWWRLAMALPCALIAGGLAASHGAQGVLVIAALVVGAGCGWMLPTVLGALLALTAHLTGLAIGLAVVAGVIGLGYVLVTAGGH